MVFQRMLDETHVVWIFPHSIIVRNMSSPDESAEEVEDVAVIPMRNRCLLSRRVILAVRKPHISASVRFMARNPRRAARLVVN
jgi:hypothetical protein